MIAVFLAIFKYSSKVSKFKAFIALIHFHFAAILFG